MSTETVVAAIKAQLIEPERSRLRAEAIAAEPRSWMRRSCALGGRGHVVVRALPDFDRDTANRVINTGYVCLDCRVAFGGGLGLMDFRNVLPLEAADKEQAIASS